MSPKKPASDSAMIVPTGWARPELEEDVEVGEEVGRTKEGREENVGEGRGDRDVVLLLSAVTITTSTSNLVTSSALSCGTKIKLKVNSSSSGKPTALILPTLVSTVVLIVVPDGEAESVMLAVALESGEVWMTREEPRRVRKSCGRTEMLLDEREEGPKVEVTVPLAEPERGRICHSPLQEGVSGTSLSVVLHRPGSQVNRGSVFSIELTTCA